MSKLSSDTVSQAIASVLQKSKEKPRKFLETIDLQVGLKNVDPNKRLSGAIALPLVPRPKYSVCILGHQAHIDEAKKLDNPTMSQDELKLLNKDKKKVRSLAKKFNAFLASNTLIRLIPRLLGPGLAKAGKFPSVINSGENMKAKISEAKATVKFQLKNKKSLCMGVPVGNVGMKPEEVLTNLTAAINFLVGLLPKNWQNIRRLYIKSSMGPSHQIYGF